MESAKCIKADRLHKRVKATDILQISFDLYDLCTGTMLIGSWLLSVNHLSMAQNVDGADDMATGVCSIR